MTALAYVLGLQVLQPNAEQIERVDSSELACVKREYPTAVHFPRSREPVKRQYSSPDVQQADEALDGVAVDLDFAICALDPELLHHLIPGVSKKADRCLQHGAVST